MRWRVALVAAVTLLTGACFRTVSTSTVGADGKAATEILVELDLEAFEDAFAGMAEAFGGEEGASSTTEADIVSEFRSQVDDINAELDDLYERFPQLEDRLSIETSIDDKTLRIQTRALTEDIGQLIELYQQMLGQGGGDLGRVFGIDEPLLGESASTFEGGAGLFSDISGSMGGGRFTFEAEPPDSGGFASELEAFGSMEDFAPSIELTIVAPGNIISTNGEVDGRSVTWKLEGTETEALTLESEVDDSIQVGSLSDLDDLDIASTSDGGSAAPLIIGVVLVLLAAAGAIVLLRRRQAGSSIPQGSDAPSAEVDPSAAAPTSPIDPELDDAAPSAQDPGPTDGP